MNSTGVPLSYHLVASFSLFTIGLGLIGNPICFFIFRFHSSFKNMPSMVYLSFVAVSDTFALFEWNLNHFNYLIYKFDLTSINLVYCRIYTFVQYTSLQMSALTLSIMCVDRFVTVVAMPGSFLHKLPFRTTRSAFIWSSGVAFFTISFNFFILVCCGFYRVKTSNNTTFVDIDCNSCATGLDLSPTWDQINMVFYNIIPFLIMISTNSLLIIDIYKSRSNTNVYSQSRVKSITKRRNLTVSLLFLTFLFLIMTTPGTVLFGFFYDTIYSTLGLPWIYLIDDISFLNNSILFWGCLLSNRKFRRAVVQILRRCLHLPTNSRFARKSSNTTHNTGDFKTNLNTPL